MIVIVIKFGVMVERYVCGQRNSNPTREYRPIKGNDKGDICEKAK